MASTATPVGQLERAARVLAAGEHHGRHGAAPPPISPPMCPCHEMPPT